MSRFLATLGQEPHLTHLRQIFDTQVGRLGAVIGDFGKDTAGDSTGLAGRAATSNLLVRVTVTSQPEGTPVFTREWPLALASGAAQSVEQWWKPAAWPAGGFTV